jgi:His-Xaa-Ser system protein HxsD
VTVTLAYDRESMSLDALQRAAYAVAATASAEIRSSAAGWEVRLFPRDAITSPEELQHRFRTEAVDQALRIRIAAETVQVRNLVLALVFSRTGLADG